MSAAPDQSAGRNLLEMVPERNREWVRLDSGEIRVLEPRYGRSSLGRWLASHVPRPDIEIKLDAIGSAVWEECDGTSSVAQIIEHLRDRFGARIEPAAERLGRFFTEMERNRLIRWK